MVAGMSPEWLPPGFTEKIKIKNGRKIKYYYNVATGVQYHSKKDVIRFAKTGDVFHDTPQKTNDDDGGISSGDKVDAVSIETNKGTEWLPNGWIMEERIRKNGSRQGSTYKIYMDPSTGKIFYSRLAVARYLKNVDHNGGMIENKLDSVGESSKNQDMSLQCKSLTEAGCAPRKKLKRKKSDIVVATQSTSADGLPPGWIKETKTSKSGKKIRKDPYYIDPVSGYIFFSKKDALRYLETNDIRSCASLPKRKEIEDLQLNKSELHLDSVGGSSKNPVMSLQCKSLTEAGRTPRKKLERKKSYIVVATQSTSADGLPPGWIKEIKTSKSGKKIRKDPYYIDPASGYIFFSKKDALRYLETNDISSCASLPKRKEIEDLQLNKSELHLVDGSFLKSDALLQCKSMTDADCLPEKKRASKHSSTMVSTEITSADGLPPGWIKEIKTSKSGNKIRKDANYTDPISGYMFRSKNDVLRYLKTNDISSCASKPKRRELDDIKLIENKIPLDNLGKPLLKSDIPLQCKPVTDEGYIPENKRKSKKSFTTVATERASANGLPPGWIKEIKTSKSGNKTRKDPYYTDPVSGYIFYSKKDVLRYLETNDISSCCITPKRRELDDLQLENTGETFLKPATRLQVKSMVDEGCIPEMKKKSKSLLTTVATESTSVDGLPPGWIKEIRTSKSGDKIRKDPYYTDPVSGYMFRSKKDVFRYLETNDIGSCAIAPKRKDLHDLKLKNKIPLANVDEPFAKPDVLNRRKSIMDATCVAETKLKSQDSSTMVATESASADGLPLGWIKEIKISKSGDKIRKDPYYTDPDNGYIFRSKKDALRFLETKDIRSCAIKPKRRELDDLNLIKNKIHSASPINEMKSELHEAKRKLFVGGESKAVGESSSTRSLLVLEAEILKVSSPGASSLRGKNSGKNSCKHTEMERSPEQTNEGSDQGARAMADVLAICNSIKESLFEEKLPENETEKQTDQTQAGLRKSKKRRDLNLPSRASKRLSRREPKMRYEVDLSEKALGSVARRSPAASVLLSDLDQAKDVAEHAFISKKALQENTPINKVEKPLEDENAISTKQTGGKASGEKLDDSKMSQESQLGYAFGDTWPDPCLEFAFKTLTGEIPIQDNLAFPGDSCNQEDGCSGPSESNVPFIVQSDIPPGFESSKQSIPCNQEDGCLGSSESNVHIIIHSDIPPGYESSKPSIPCIQEDGSLGPSESNVPIIFQSDIPPGFESSNQIRTVEKLPSNLSLSPPKSINFTTCSGVVSQQPNQGQEHAFPGKSS